MRSNGTLFPVVGAVAGFVLCLFTYACDGTSTSPSNNPIGSGGGGLAPLPTTTANPPPAAPAPPEEDEGHISGRIFRPSRGALSGRGTNELGRPAIVALACYKPGSSPPSAQNLIDGIFAEERVADGRDFELSSVPEPLCDYQCDLYWYPPGGKYAGGPPEPPLFQANLLIDAKFGGDPEVSACLPPPPCFSCGEKSCDDLFSLRTEVGPDSVWAELVDKKGNVVARKHFPRRDNGYVGEICSDDGDNHSEEQHLTSNDERCCFPVEVPPRQCNREALELEAKKECGELGVESLDFEKCSFTCNEDPCVDAFLEVKVRHSQTEAQFTINSDTAGIITINGREKRFEKGETVFRIDLECGTEYVWSAENRCGETDRGRFGTDDCEEPCDVDALNAEARAHKQRCDAAGGEYTFEINVRECKLIDECKIPPPCDVDKLRAEVRERKAKCEANDGTYRFRIDEDACRIIDECIPNPPECKVPEVQSFRTERSIGDPRAECSFFGNYVPTDGPGDFFVTKCGLFYQVTHDPFEGEKCSNGQDVSHSTPCVCAPEDD